MHSPLLRIEVTAMATNTSKLSYIVRNMKSFVLNLSTLENKLYRLTAVNVTTLSRCYVNQAHKLSNDVVNCLRQIVGDKNVNTSLAVREQYSLDESYRSPTPADAVVIAHSTEEVSEIAKLCYQNFIPMVPHGAGTGVEQGVGALKGGVCVDLSQMTNILRVNKEDFDATVECGVTRQGLNAYLRDTGLIFPVDPGAEASLGGMAATGASGTNAVKYGTMKENVLNLEVVLADGTVFDTAGKGRRTRKSSAGYNLTNLFVGSEGTLGFITKVTLRLHAIPESTLTAVCSFPSEKNAIDTVIQVLQMNVDVARIEFLDDVAMDAANKYSNLVYPVAPSLFLEFHGLATEIDAQVKLVEEIATDNKGSHFLWAKDAEIKSKLWKARHQIFYATLAQRPSYKCVTTDVCVPISNLTEMIVESKKDILDAGIFGNVLGHVGDGNFHTLLMYNPQNRDEYRVVQELEHRIAMRALSLDGTCTGEHGIGTGKIQLLKQELGDVGISVMQSIKLALDPRGLMNPGKIFQL